MSSFRASLFSANCSTQCDATNEEEGSAISDRDA